MASTPESKFFCDSCRIAIGVILPRLHCLICSDFDLCANCALGERFPPNHLAEHAVQVYKHSGQTFGGAVLGRVAISFAAVSSYPIPSQPQHVVALPLPPRPDNLLLTPGANSAHGAPVGVTGWQPFFNLDTTQTPTYIMLADEIFTYLDPQGVGVLLPEALSQFLDDMEYPEKDNYWKHGATDRTPSSQVLAARDKFLKKTFGIFSIEHQMFQRIQGPPTMPTITRKGFRDILPIDLLCEPARHFDPLSRVIQKYNLPIYQRFGPLPRIVLPMVPLQAMLDRVAAATAAGKQNADTEALMVQAAGLLNPRSGAMQMMFGHRLGSLV